MSDVMEVLDHNRTIRVRARKSQWERAVRNHACEVQDLVRRGVERELRKMKRDGYPVDDDPYITLTIAEHGWPYGAGRSLDYWHRMIRQNGLRLEWQTWRSDPVAFDPAQPNGRSVSR